MPHIDPNIPGPIGFPVPPPPPPTFPPRGPAPGPIGQPTPPIVRIPGSDADLLQIAVDRFLCGLGDENACAALRARGLALEPPPPVSRVPGPPGTPPFIPSQAPVVGPPATPPFVDPGAVLPPFEPGPTLVEQIVLGAARAVSSVFQRGPLTRPIVRTEGGGSGVLPREFSWASVGSYAAAVALTGG